MTVPPSGRRVLLGGALAGLASPPVSRAQPTALKIGVLTDMSSVYADYAGVGSVEAARMAIADAGLGEKVQVVFADHQNKPDIGSNLARAWYGSHGVDAIFDCPTSSVALAVNTVAGQARKLCMFSTAIIDRLNEEDCNGYGLSWTWDIYSVARSGVLLQMRRGLDTWFIVHQDYAAGHALAAAAKEALEGAGGRVVGQVAHPLGTTDYSAYLLQAQASRAKFVFFTAGGSDLINALKQAREFGLMHGLHRRHRCARHRAGRPAGPQLRHRLLLGPRRTDPRLRPPVLRRPAEAADHVPGRRLLRRFAVPECGEGHGRDQGRGSARVAAQPFLR